MTRLIPLRWWHLEHVMAMEHELFAAEAWSREMFWSELADPAAYYVLAVPSDARSTDPPVGYAGLAVSGSEAFIQTIGVTSRAQRQGLGRCLMRVLLAEAVRRGAQVCWLEVRTDNAPAQQLYRTLGFGGRGVRKGYYQPSGADALVMARPLGPSAVPA